MLRIEDCKPGVEIVCIKTKPENKSISPDKPDVFLGHIYTIGHFTTWGTMNGIVVDIPGISLRELQPDKWRESPWLYYLEQFKLRNSEELVDLFRLNDIPKDILHKEKESA